MADGSPSTSTAPPKRSLAQPATASATARGSRGSTASMPAGTVVLRGRWTAGPPHGVSLRSPRPTWLARHRLPGRAGKAVLDIRTTDAEAVDDDGPRELSKRSVLVAVLRRGGPKILEASVAPAALFYVCLVFGSLGVAYAAAVAWLYGSLARRLVRRQPVSQVLVLSVIGITIRTTIAVASGSSFMYFAQPILGTLVTGGVFLASLIGGRPLIGRLADDFWPVTPEMHQNPQHHLAVPRPHDPVGRGAPGDRHDHARPAAVAPDAHVRAGQAALGLGDHVLRHRAHDRVVAPHGLPRGPRAGAEPDGDPSVPVSVALSAASRSAASVRTSVRLQNAKRTRCRPVAGSS